MPRAAKTPKIDPDAIVVAWQAGACEIDGIGYSVAEGEHRRGSDPFVQAHPWLFVADGSTIEAEQRNAFSGVVERADRERAAVEHEIQLSGHVPQALEAEDVVTLTRAVTVRAGYVGDSEIVRFEAGAIFSARSEIAGLLPADAFEPVSGRQVLRPKSRRR